MSNPQSIIDTRALEMANEARTKVEAVERALGKHEDNCVEAHRESTKRFDRMSDKMDAGFKAIHEKLDEVKDRSTSWWKSALVWIIVVLVGLAAYLLANGAPFIRAANAHGQYAWVQPYSNGKISCCDMTDTVFIEHHKANPLQIGDSIVVDFPSVKQVTVTVLKIYQTEDPKGRPVITRYGCLFKAFGM